MLPFDFNLQQLFMIITLLPRPLQLPHLILIQPPPRRLLELPSADLGQRLVLLVLLEARLEARLHPDPECCVERDDVAVAADLRPCRSGFGGGLDC